MTELPPRQRQLHDLLFGKGDVSIAALYHAMRDTGIANDETSTQAMQRWLGSYITALNRSLVDRQMCVEPGALKNTYRLVVMTT